MKSLSLLLSIFAVSSPIIANDLATQKEFGHHFWYNKLGGGVISTSHGNSGAIAVGCGVRGHPNRLGWDFSLDAMLRLATHGRRPVFASVKGLGLIYATPSSCRSLYAGLGLGIGARFRETSRSECRDINGVAGLFGEFAIGYEWLTFYPIRVRVKDEEGCRFTKADLPIHLFVQLSVHQPAIVSTRGNHADYNPAISLELGMGY